VEDAELVVAFGAAELDPLLDDADVGSCVCVCAPGNAPELAAAP
jgi:hypothetical protein